MCSYDTNNSTTVATVCNMHCLPMSEHYILLLTMRKISGVARVKGWVHSRSKASCTLSISLHFLLVPSHLSVLFSLFSISSPLRSDPTSGWRFGCAVSFLSGVQGEIPVAKAFSTFILSQENVPVSNNFGCLRGKMSIKTAVLMVRICSVFFEICRALKFCRPGNSLDHLLRNVTLAVNWWIIFSSCDKSRSLPSCREALFPISSYGVWGVMWAPQ